MTQVKTNAMRILDAKGISYNAIAYDGKDGKIDGVSVAKKLGRDPETVYKTLVTQGDSGNIYVFIIPVMAELDMKKAAIAAEEKKVDMIQVKEIQKLTGYIRGGCSPIGMKKTYPTYIEQESLGLGNIAISGGRIGVQIALHAGDLRKAVGAGTADLMKKALN